MPDELYTGIGRIEIEDRMTSVSHGARHALIVDRHRLFAEAVMRTLERKGFVVAAATNTHAALGMAAAMTPDMALIEIAHQGASGLALGRRFRALHPRTTLIAVTVTAEPRLITESRAAGFHAVVTKDMPSLGLLEAVETVGGGRNDGAGCDGGSSVTHRPPDGRSVRREGYDHIGLIARQLTDREWDVLELIVEGAGGGDIANRLGLSANTVRSYIQSVLTKLQVHSRLEAAGFAARHGLVREQPPGRRNLRPSP